MSQMTRNLRIELVYARDCPNVNLARAMVSAALAAVGAQKRWIEWDRDDPATPPGRRLFGSPTVLVNGQDVGCNENEEVQSDAHSCRVYMDECGCLCGAPSAGLIARAIRGALAA